MAQLKEHLVRRFVALVDAQEKYHVIRKLAAAIVALLFRDKNWMHPIQDLGVAFRNGTINQQSHNDFENTTLPSLNEAQITGLLCFSTTAAEEAIKVSNIVCDRSVILSSPEYLFTLLKTFQWWSPCCRKSSGWAVSLQLCSGSVATANIHRNRYGWCECRP